MRSTLSTLVRLLLLWTKRSVIAFFFSGLVSQSQTCNDCNLGPATCPQRSTTTTAASTSTSPATTTPPTTTSSQPTVPPTLPGCLSALSPCGASQTPLQEAVNGRLCLSGSASPFGVAFDVLVECELGGQTTRWSVCVGAQNAGCAGCLCGCALDALLTENANAQLGLPGLAPFPLRTPGGVCLEPLSWLPSSAANVSVSCAAC